MSGLTLRGQYAARREAIMTKLDTVKRLVNEHQNIGPINGPMIGDLKEIDRMLTVMIEFLGDIDDSIR